MSPFVEANCCFSPLSLLDEWSPRVMVSPFYLESSHLPVVCISLIRGYVGVVYLDWLPHYTVDSLSWVLLFFGPGPLLDVF